MVYETIKLLAIIIRLKSIKGLHKPRVLTKKERNSIRSLNSPENVGVEEVLNKKNVILVFHDSKFRNPPTEITKKFKDRAIFPSVPFKEIKGAISASPNKGLHFKLINKTKVKGDWASLLVGFN